MKLTKVSTPENEIISENLLVSNSIDLSTIAQERMEETEEAGGGIGGGGQGNESGMKSRGAGRKQHHWKSQSVGESTVTVTVTTGSDSHNQCNSQNSSSNGCTFPGGGSGGQSTEEDIQHEQTTFSANRELWQRRATSQTQLNPPIPPGGNTTTTSSKSYRSSQEFREMRQKQTPDLVMDLPLSAQDASKKSASSSSLSSSDDETSIVLPTRTTEAATSPTGGPESPDMSTAAERFAKQNQCTLKKNTKTNPEGSKLKRLETADHLESADMEGTEEIVRSASTNQISDSLALRSPLPPRSTPKIVAKFADMHLTGGSQVSSFKPQVKVKPTILRKPVLPFPHPHMSPELARKIEKQAQSAEQAN